jgi:hypothetical protein
LNRRQLFQAVGEALYGDSYRVRLNAQLASLHPDGPKSSLNGRMVADWDNGKIGIPNWVMCALPSVVLRGAEDRERGATVLVAKAMELRRLADKLSRETG